MLDSQRRRSGHAPSGQVDVFGREEEEEERTKVDLATLQVLDQTEVRRISSAPHHDRLRD